MNVRVKFYGVCLFSTSSQGGFEVLLPEASKPGNRRHHDGDDPAPHYAYVFAEDRYVDRNGSTGFRAEHGCHHFDLATPITKDCRRVVVPAPADTPFDERVSRLLPSFSDFLDGIALAPKRHHRSAAFVHIRRGRVTVPQGYLTTTYWKIEDGLNQAPAGKPIKLGRLPFRVDWEFVTNAPSLDVQVFPDRQAGSPMATLRLQPHGNLTELIVGNVDHKDPWDWKGRQPQPIDNCPDTMGNGNDRECPDRDFKWLYQLYTTKGVRGRLTRKGGQKYLSSPRIDWSRTRLVYGGDPEKWPEGASTPTCFPGTD